jgi:hypothetical protein
MMFPVRGPADMESLTTTFALLEQSKGGDDQALSRAFERHRRRLAVLIHYRLSPHARVLRDYFRR